MRQILKSLLKGIIMNKLAVSFISISLISSAVIAEEPVSAQERNTGVFIGLDVFDGETELTREFSSSTGKSDIDQSGFRLKFGVQDKNNIRFQGYFKVESLGNDIPALASDGKIYGFGADAMFTFPTSSNFSPYVLIGLSSDFAELDDDGTDYSEDSLSAFALKAGAGGLFKLNKQFEFQIGYDVHYRSWQEIQSVDITGSVDLEQHDVSKIIYVGLNFFF
ncbi:MAG: opacity protein-like surface antigen [Oleiphilaceae bacterium]|jgi:opacity protein-like surface antigen